MIKAVVAAAVKGVGVDAAEVADTGQGHVEQAVQELPHAVAAQGDLRADGHAFAQLEVCDALLGLADDGLLARDLHQVGEDRVHDLRIIAGFAAADVDHDFIQLRDLHHAFVVEFLHQSGSNFLGVGFL